MALRPPASCVPALRDALAPHDPPVALDYTANAAPRLTDAHGCELGDPVQEFVDDVLARVDAVAGVFRVAHARGRIRPTRVPGAELDLAELAQTLSQVPLVAVLYPPLLRRSIDVAIDMTVQQEPREPIAIDVRPRVMLVWSSAALPAALDDALSAYPRALASLVAQLSRGSLAPWLRDSGIAHLNLAGQFTVPVAAPGGRGTRSPSGFSDPPPRFLH